MSEIELAHNPPTDYGAFVIDTLARMTRESRTMDQKILRRCIGLASSYLVTDTSMNPEYGLCTWTTGFLRLGDVISALHFRGELEMDTVNEASKACSECWSVSGTWRGLDGSREGVRAVAAKLKSMLDENGRTYRGETVYAP